ncbi:MAG: amino acid ABC transporter permease [Christensenellales bacterium]
MGINIGSIFNALMSGVGYTVGLFFITILLSMPLGLGLTYLSNSKSRVLHLLTRGYVFIMRGTPLMLQLFFFYFALPFIPGIGQFLTMDRFTTACVAFVLNYAAYFCEIFRGGLLAIDKGQYEAAKVLGFSKWQMTRKIIVPQMVKVVLPSVSNESITLIKDTALVTAIGVADLMHMAKAQVNSLSNIFPYIVAAFFYLVMTFGLTKLFGYFEKRFNY